ncbi:MAG: hypothetical protein IT306_22655, partial [Chloroflexi bacterium]|nr:hypothetical protein [Chloroflexota bacterium]
MTRSPRTFGAVSRLASRITRRQALVGLVAGTVGAGLHVGGALHGDAGGSGVSTAERGGRPSVLDAVVDAARVAPSSAFASTAQAPLAQTSTTTWHQHGGNAARTGANDATPVGPWTWLWSDGPDTNGGTSTWRGMVPVEAFPVCGGGRLFMPRGTAGVWAWDLAAGAIAWRFTGVEAVASGAYDPTSASLLVGATNNR